MDVYCGISTIMICIDLLNKEGNATKWEGRLIYFILGLLPLAFILAFSGLEIGIAFIQAQVFVVLSSSYIKDALDLH